MNDFLNDLPHDMLIRVLAGKASSKDLADAKRYLALLQHRARSAAGELEKPVDGRPTKVGQAYHGILDENTGEVWDFIVEVFSDRTTRWLDIAGLRAMLTEAAQRGPDAVKAAEKREGEFVVTATISDEVYFLVTEVQVFIAKGSEITPEMSEKLEGEMEEIFWRDVNPLLTHPIVLPAKG